MKTGHLIFLSVICIFLLFDFITEIQSARVQYQYKKYTYRKKRDVSCSDIYIITTFQYLNLCMPGNFSKFVVVTAEFSLNTDIQVDLQIFFNIHFFKYSFSNNISVKQLVSISYLIRPDLSPN